MSLFFEYPFPRKSVVMSPKKKNIAEAGTRDMASSVWLKLATLCLFRAQSISKNKSICDCARARPQSDQHSYLLHSWINRKPRNIISFRFTQRISQPLTDWVHERKIAGIWYRSEEIDIQFREYQSCGILTQPILLKTVRLSVIALSASVNIDLNFNSLHRKTSGCQGWRRSITYRFESLTIDRIYS